MVLKDKDDKYQALLTDPRCKLNEDMVSRMCESIRKGNYIYRVAEAAGISKETFYRWVELGQAGEEPYTSLVTELKRADAEGETAIVDKIHELGQTNWTALMTLISRKYPGRWQEAVRLQHEHDTTPELRAYMLAHAESAKRLRKASVIEGDYALQEPEEG